MTQEQKEETTNNEEKKDDKKDDKKEEKSDSGAATLDDVKRIVDDAIEGVKKLISGDTDNSDSGDGDGDDDKDDKPGNKEVTRRSFSAIERNAEEMVQSAVRKVLGEVNHEKEHKELAEAKKKEPEKAPIKVRKSTRFWLGKDYGQD